MNLPEELQRIKLNSIKLFERKQQLEINRQQILIENQQIDMELLKLDGEERLVQRLIIESTLMDNTNA